MPRPDKENEVTIVAYRRVAEEAMKLLDELGQLPTLRARLDDLEAGTNESPDDGGDG
jgi:hypothetical protein